MVKVPRAERLETNALVELHVGPEEVMQRGFPTLARASAGLTLAARDGRMLETTPARSKRIVRLANISATGLGIEGGVGDCHGIAPGTLVALRLEPLGPPELGVVVRAQPAVAEGTTWIGVKRLSARARAIEAVPSAARGERTPRLLFVPGNDDLGRHDACLVDAATYEREAPIEAHIGDCIYAVHLQHIRERGRGWVLAAFEIAAPVAPGDAARAPVAARAGRR